MLWGGGGIQVFIPMQPHVILPHSLLDESVTTVAKGTSCGHGRKSDGQNCRGWAPWLGFIYSRNQMAAHPVRGESGERDVRDELCGGPRAEPQTQFSSTDFYFYEWLQTIYW